MILRLPAPAKLNLFLHITGRRPDGYHNLQSVFQLLDVGDELAFEALETQELVFSCNEPSLETSDNLVLRAARLLQGHARKQAGCRITLQKRLPQGGGVGGGSSDAATTLLALNYLWDCQLTQAELMQIGLELGADVPVFVAGHTAWAEGVGEKLVKLELPELFYLVISPPCITSTGEIFSHPQLTRSSAPIRIPPFPFSGCTNDCQKVACMLYPEIQIALDWLDQHAQARMTGTGSSVFASFSTQDQALEILAQLPSSMSGFVARGVNQSPLQQVLEAKTGE